MTLLNSLPQHLEKLHPPGYVYAATAVSLGGFLNGYDTGCVGAVTEMPYFVEKFHLSPSMRGFTVAFLMLMGAFSSLPAGQLADRFGRLVIAMCGALLFALGATLQGGANGIVMFLVGRAFCGLGEGLWLGNVIVYICEIAPSKTRGVIVSIPQLFTAIGLAAGYFTAYGSVHISSSFSWRVPYIVQAGCGVALAVACMIVPNSPRWLVLHGRRDEALKALDKLSYSRTEAEKDILHPENQTSLPQGFWDMCTLIFRRKYRMQTFLALFILGMAQLSGIDGVLYYAPVLFAQAGLSSQQASFLASGVSALLNLAVTIPAFLFADKWGRRKSTILGGLMLSSCMFIMGSLYASNSVHSYGIARWVVVVLVFTFGLTYCVTWGMVGKIYASEIQPQDTRAAANCVAQSLGFFTNWLIAIITPILLAKSSFGAYFLFGALALFTVAVLAANMPETRGRSLESIEQAFVHRQKSWLYHVRRLFSSTSSSDSPRSVEQVEMSRTSGGEAASETSVSIAELPENEVAWAESL